MASSITVKSAPKVKSNTYVKPALFKAVTNFSVTILPFSKPNSSPIVVLIAGAIEIVTMFSLSFKSSNTFS